MPDSFSGAAIGSTGRTCPASSPPFLSLPIHTSLPPPLLPRALIHTSLPGALVWRLSNPRQFLRASWSFPRSSVCDPARRRTPRLPLKSEVPVLGGGGVGIWTVADGESSILPGENPPAKKHCQVTTLALLLG
ncbi:hypothetical protein EJB05_11581 [Eragrostis curvula]|uniref:Uncharacterized protein n=1 Tax=Eragrostis curvula TaxID=38414 RepID=A0A5J9VS34_9POAL|nr:hypothetical protein EJB05_11581 [Eragrostis curvula]